MYKHWPGKTVTEYDDHLFCLLTMNHHPLHLDAHYAQETTDFKRNVVVGNYVYSLLLGMSVADVSGKAIANLEVESLRHIRPTFHGDTLYGETEVLDKTPSPQQGRPGRRLRRDPRLQPGRHGRLRLPAEGHGAHAGLRRRARRRAAGAGRYRRSEPGVASAVHPAGARAGDGSLRSGEGPPIRSGPRAARRRAGAPPWPRGRRNGRPARRRRRAAGRRRRCTGSPRWRTAPHDAADQLARRTRSPVSSRISRTSAAASSSPASTRPPGTDHSPRPGSFARWTSSSRPASS